MFNVAMGNFDRSEVTHLVGLFPLSQHQHFKGIIPGLYHERQIKKMFESNGLKIIIEVNLVVLG